MPRPRKSSTKQKEEQKQSIAYFLELEVENVLCFKDRQHLNLSNKDGLPAQWTVILGDNGTGKTTLLRCIAAMSTETDSSFDNGLTSVLSNYYNHKSLWYWRHPDKWFDPEWQIDALVVCNPYFRKLKITKEELREDDLIWLEHYGLDNHEGYNHTKLSSLICYGYGAVRKTGNTQLNKNFYQETSSSLFSDQGTLLNAEEWLLQTDYSSKYLEGEKKENIIKKLNDITEAFRKALPDIADLRFVLDENFNDNLTVQFLTSYGWVAFSDLGLGYKTMIVWMLDLIIRLYERYPDSEDPLSEPAIVLVDEIDLHLHPKWQRQIMSFLTERFPNTQFIVTAHSPLVVQASQDANIVLLRREGDRVVIDNNPEIIDNWRVDQILTSLFELPSARPATLDPYIEEREQILSKTHLTEEDRTRLDELREKIGSLPTGERPEDRKAMDIIRRAAKLIEEQNQQ